MAYTWMAVLAIFLLTAQAGAAETSALKTQKERVSYGLGVDAVRNFLRSGVEFDVEVLVKGIRDEAARGKLLLTEDELRTTMSQFHDEQAAKREQVANKLANENRKVGEEFLAENKTQEGVVALPSGLQYKVLKAGSGRKPTDADTVECQFRVSLLNGTEIASSRRTGVPAAMKVAGVMAGLTEALKLMPVGSKWELYLRPELAYGEKGTGSGIGPNSTVIFEVELLAIK